MNWKIKLWTVLGDVHDFVLLNRTAAEMLRFRKLMMSCNTIEFTHRETDEVFGFIRVNIVNFTISKIQGGQDDVRDQYDFDVK